LCVCVWCVCVCVRVRCDAMQLIEVSRSRVVPTNHHSNNALSTHHRQARRHTEGGRTYFFASEIELSTTAKITTTTSHRREKRCDPRPLPIPMSDVGHPPAATTHRPDTVRAPADVSYHRLWQPRRRPNRLREQQFEDRAGLNVDAHVVVDCASGASRSVS
jgi:hypothetical protein